MHQTSGRWQFGFVLSLITVLFWGVLPLALKGLLLQMDVMTVTWYRFLVAAVLLGGYLAWQKRLPSLAPLKQPAVAGLMAIAIAGLTSNYAFYLIGLDYITPSGAQVMIQLAPMLLLLGGLIVFREQFNVFQWLGFGIFFLGLIMFFNQRIGDIFSQLGEYTLGILWIVAAAVTWACYALAQKQLLKVYQSEEIMLAIYIAGALLFLPLSQMSSIDGLDTLGWGLLAFCCLNTLIAYGAFAEALAHWEASRVSAVLAITPLVTIFAMYLLELWRPDSLPIEPFNTVGIIGACCVVMGSALTALSKNTPAKRSAVMNAPVPTCSDAPRTKL